MYKNKYKSEYDKCDIHSFRDQYESVVCKLEPHEWNAIISKFSDASVVQTISYAKARWPASDLFHLILQHKKKIVSAVQVRVIKIPLFGGFAYIRWGPLWRLHGSPENIEIFRQSIRAIRREFAERLGCLVQIIPRETEDRQDLLQILKEESYSYKRSNYTTIIIDIRASEEEIRANLVARWRTELNRSIRNNLSFTEGDELELYERFMPIYDEMFDRKKLVDFGDLAVYQLVQSDLPDDLKMKVMLCAPQGEADGAGAVTSAIGSTGIAILWATNNIGRDTRGAYFLQWKVIQWLKQQGCLWYDVGGVNKQVNPGGHRFKSGLGGKKGKEVEFLGQFHASPTRVHEFLFQSALSLRHGLRKLRQITKKFKIFDTK